MQAKVICMNINLHTRVKGPYTVHIMSLATFADGSAKNINLVEDVDLLASRKMS